MVLLVLAAFVLLCIIVLVVRRLYLSPLSRFPGPKLAALTYFYEFYYDFWPHQGRYTWKIRELHVKYGSFIRINPHEIHCNDPDFFDTLYVSAAKRRTDKTLWAARQSWTRNSTFKTREHDLHRRRRSHLSPFFSKSSIRTLQPLIRRKVERLCSRLEESSNLVLRERGSVVCLTHVHVALTLDVISRVCFGYSYDFLENPFFARDWYKTMDRMARSQHLIRQFPGIFHFLHYLPSSLGGSSFLRLRTASARVQTAKDRQRDLFNHVASIISRHPHDEKLYQEGDESFTIFDAILSSDVPPEEKSLLRLTEEAQALIGAGTLSTAGTLDTITYHLLSNPPHLAKLRQELQEAFPDDTDIIHDSSTADLEKLPYLTAVIYEGLRLSKGITHRLARISPDVAYTYSSPKGETVLIPRGVAVGMTSLDILESSYIFPDPHEFLPGRWLPLDSEEVRERLGWLQSVFGGGSRVCLGINLAWAELYLTTAVVVRRFGARLRLTKDMLFERDIKITTDGFNALPSRDSRGLRVMVLPGLDE